METIHLTPYKKHQIVQLAKLHQVKTDISTLLENEEVESVINDDVALETINTIVSAYEPNLQVQAFYRLKRVFFEDDSKHPIISDNCTD